MSRVIQRYNLTSFEAEYRAQERRKVFRRIAAVAVLLIGVAALFF